MKAFATLLLALAGIAAAQAPDLFTAPPALIYRVEPQYTPAARAAGLEGVVTLYAEIGRDGRATHIRVTHSLGMGLDRKAIEAVRQWRFQPGWKNGKPVTVASSIEVRFQLPHRRVRV